MPRRRSTRCKPIPSPPPAEATAPLEPFLDILQDAVLIVTSNNCIRRANPAATELLGGGPSGLAGRPLADLPDGAALGKLVQKVRAAGRCQFGEIPLQAVGGPCDIAGIRLAPGAGAEAALVLRNVALLRRLEHASEEYATNVSHELKTPLTLILGFTETLLSHPETEPAFRDRSLRTVERHTRRILRIIDDLLRLAWLKSETASTGIPRSQVAVATVVAEAVELCHEWTRAADITVKTHVPAGLTWHLNAGLLEEALVNLIRNAILYALVGPIEIRARVLKNGNLRLAVIDRGPGLKPEDAARIFDRFYRVDKGRSRASGGSGLGLPIVQQIVEAHRGTARVETSPGQGCTFVLEIPPAPQNQGS